MKFNFCCVVFVLFCLSDLYSSVSLQEKLQEYHQMFKTDSDDILYYARLLSERENSGFEHWEEDWDKWVSFDDWNGKVTAPWYSTRDANEGYNYHGLNFGGPKNKPPKRGQLSVKGQIREKLDEKGDNFASDAYRNDRNNKNNILLA